MPLPTLLPGFSGTVLPPWLERRLQGGLAGVCLFAENIASAGQLRALSSAVRAANPLALVAVDEEGGDVTRLHTAAGSPFPGNAWLGRRDDLATTRRVARVVADQLLSVGCNLDLAPCLDVNSDPANPVVGVRSFGASPPLVARHGAAWVESLQAAGVAACAKHFPGHGHTSVDSHAALPVVDADLRTLQARELLPFRAAVDAGCLTVMTGHLLVPSLDPAVPATFSTRVLDGLLRDGLGFGGVVVSDALDMAGASGGSSLAEAAVRALAGGCDLLCLGSGTTEAELDSVEEALDAALREGRLARHRVREAEDRVRALAERVRLAPVADDAPYPMQAAVSDLGVVARCFEVGEHAARLLARPGRWTLVRVDTPPDAATGPTPWGPFALRTADLVADATTAPDDLPAGRVAVVGRGNHRFEWVRRLVDAARARDGELLVVDMGWPGDDRGYADIATYGGSRLVGEALLTLLDQAFRPSDG